MALAGLLACAEGPTTPRAVPDDWIRHEACRGALTFWLSSDLAPRFRQPIDSCVEDLEAPRMVLALDYGWYSSDLSELHEADLVEWAELVDGRHAVFQTATWDPAAPLVLRTSVHVPEVHPGRGTRLTMVSRGASQRERDEALAVFRSIDFAE